MARVLERGQSSGRGDDNIEVMRKRLQTYEKETRRLHACHVRADSPAAAIIDIFAGRSLVRAIDSTQPVDAVFGDVSKLFQ